MSAGSDDLLYFDITAEPANRFTVARDRNSINELEKVEYRSGTTSLQTLDEDYVTLLVGFIFRRFSPFFETFNEITGRLESNGMMEKFRKNSKPFKRKAEELGPQVLTMYQLRLGFLACLILAASSIVVFIGELMWSMFVITFRKKLPKIFEEKWEIVTFNVDENNLMQDDLIEAHSIGEENSMVVEDIELKSMDEVAVESEMCLVKQASNHPELSQESRDNVDENNLKKDDLIKIHVIVEKNSLSVEGVDLESLNEFQIESEMCENNPASIRPELSLENNDDIDSINELI